MTTTARILLALALCPLAGCTTNVPASPQGTSYFCGALCGSVIVVLDATSSADGLRLSIQSPVGDYPALAFFASLPGPSLQAITYDATNGSAATTVVQESPTAGVLWTQTSAANASIGSFSLTIADAGEAVSFDGGIRWPSAEGSLTATLQPTGTLTDAGLALLALFPPTTACPPALQLCPNYASYSLACPLVPAPPSCP